MIFKRKLYDKMLKWKNEFSGKSALLVKGARRVGKSTLVESFSSVLGKAVLPDTRLSIGSCAFYECESLKEMMMLGSKVLFGHSLSTIPPPSHFFVVITRQ